MAVYKRGNGWWYSFIFASRRIQESAKTRSKTVAKLAEKNRRRELEKGFNGIEDSRDDRIKSLKELARAYLEDYGVRHKAISFAEYAVGNVTRQLGEMMAIDFSDKTVKAYQVARLKEGAAPKTINEEVGFLLRLLGERGDAIRAKMRRERTLKLPVTENVGKAYTPDQKTGLLATAITGGRLPSGEKRTRKKPGTRSPFIRVAIAIGLNTGLRDGEIRQVRSKQLDLEKRVLTVGHSKTPAGEGRTIPINSALMAVLTDYIRWYTGRFGTPKPDWFLFPGRVGKPEKGKKRPYDPTIHVTTLKTSWKNVRTEAGVSGRFHDTRHTLITDLCETDTGDQTIMDIAGHVSPQMLKRYSHIRMEARRRAVESIVTNGAEPATHDQGPSCSTVVASDSDGLPTKTTTVGLVA